MNDFTTEAESEAIKLFRHCITSVPESEWDSIVRRMCEEQPESGGRLAEMLRFQTEKSTWLEGTAFSPRTKSPENRLPEVGDSLCGYRITRVLGQGSASTVVWAVGPSETPVVIKIPILRLTAVHSLQKFYNECRIHLELSHRNISRAIKVSKLENGSPMLVMQAINGVDIQQTCLQRNLSASEKMGLLLQVSSGLRYLHNNGYAHGDIKSENVIVEPVGKQLICKLIDFGKGEDFLTQRGADSVNTQNDCTKPDSSKRGQKVKAQRRAEKARAKDDDDLAWLRNRILTL